MFWHKKAVKVIENIKICHTEGRKAESHLEFNWNYIQGEFIKHTLIKETGGIVIQ